ncbi:MAG: hypothetical protein HC911_13620 [Chloroflexaceae bacterium]|nr:hypothetical protein [Chloroflexaceae bacterium]
MQLRLYLHILRRSWWLVLGLPVLVALLSTAAELRKPPRYAAFAQFMVSQEPFVLADQAGNPEPAFTDFNTLSSWQSTSYIIDDMPQVIASRAFALDVQALLTAQGYALDIGEVQHHIQAERVHRAINITTESGNPDTAQALARAAVQVMAEQGLRYWDRDEQDTNGLRIGVLDPGSPAVQLSTRSRLIVNVGLRTALALGAAIALAFLVYYLDDRLHDGLQAEAWLGVPVVGMIPKE